MIFSSMVFVFLFFSLNILIHNLCGNIKAKNLALLIFSIVFYSWAGVGFTVILLFDVFICWVFALRIGHSGGRERKVLLAGCVALLLLVLGIFKYAGFFLSNARLFTGFPEVVPEILLPVGISFYTFQLISYVADVYRGEIAAQRKFWLLLLYASLFHQCVAGPIIRYSDVEHDMLHRTVTPAQTSRGISRFTVGLAKKAILANSCAVIADTYFVGDAAVLAVQPAAGLWLAGLAFMLQIYLDFSAYSDMAIGMGLMCGFHYRENFDYPYLANSVTDFWRRWHISLSSFFRDYVYIPLGGNRRGKTRQLFNLFVVWALTGFWHGASWNYVLWGLYFFLFLALEKFLLGERLEKIPRVLRHIVVLIIIYFCWILFKFEDLHSLLTVLGGLFCLNGNPVSGLAVGLTFRANYLLLLVSVIAVTPIGRSLRTSLRWAADRGRTVFALYSLWEIAHPVLLLVAAAMALTGDSYNPFLYYIF